MAINAIAFQKLRPHIRGRVLCLGVPVVLMKDAWMEPILGIPPGKKTKAPAWCFVDETPDPYDTFERLGAELTCVDVISHDGRELVADLNYPQEFGEFDLVIDAGTTEHCFNVGQAIVNAANAVKVGGVILHTNPVSMGNHAFYNFCPTLMFDFYKANGFEMIGIEVRELKGEGKTVPFSKFGRFEIQNDWAMYYMARRLERLPVKFPIQGKYAS